MAVTLTDETEVTVAKSAQVADLAPFLQPDFDPASYLNSVLPNLAAPDVAKPSTTLADATTQTQTILSSLTTQSSRQCATLTQLTDEILRSGNRLAYEVDILRGETVGLSESLQTSPKSDMERFVPASETPHESSVEPDFVKELNTLALVRSRLDAVVKTFGDAMEWPVAPSDTASTLVSVTAPDPTRTEREEKAKQVAQRLRAEVSALVSGAKSLDQGIAAASKRIAELRSLNAVWNGTGEEKARARFLDGLEELLADEQQRLGAKGANGAMSTVGADGKAQRSSIETNRAIAEGGYGFINNLRRLKGDIFLE